MTPLGAPAKDKSDPRLAIQSCPTKPPAKSPPSLLSFQTFCTPQTPTKLLADFFLLNQLQHSVDQSSHPPKASQILILTESLNASPLLSHLPTSEGSGHFFSFLSTTIPWVNSPHLSNYPHTALLPRDPYRLTTIHPNLSSKTASNQSWINKSCT